jgi:hypothetical protein
MIMLIVLVLFLQHYDGLAIVTACYLSGVCITAYYLLALLEYKNLCITMLIVLVLFLQHYDGLAIVTVCYLSKVCITAYYLTSIIGMQEFMHCHAYSTRAVSTAL